MIDKLISLKKWATLAEVVPDVTTDNFVGKHIYKLDSGIYLRLNARRRSGIATDADGPYITAVLFAPDEGAVRRVTANDIEADSGAALTVPAELLLGERGATYGSVLQLLRDMRPKVCQETASYRIATDGKFIHREIETERFTYYFRGAEHDDLEAPYAILVKLQ